MTQQKRTSTKSNCVQQYATAFLLLSFFANSGRGKPELGRSPEYAPYRPTVSLGVVVLRVDFRRVEVQVVRVGLTVSRRGPVVSVRTYIAVTASGSADARTQQE